MQFVFPKELVDEEKLVADLEKIFQWKILSSWSQHSTFPSVLWDWWLTCKNLSQLFPKILWGPGPLCSRKGQLKKDLRERERDYEQWLCSQSQPSLVSTVKCVLLCLLQHAHVRDAVWTYCVSVGGGVDCMCLSDARTCECHVRWCLLRRMWSSTWLNSL